MKQALLFAILTFPLLIQVLIWVVLLPISLLLAAVVSIAFAVAVIKFWTTGPGINFLTPLAVRYDDLFFIKCLEKGIDPTRIRRVYRLLPSDPRCRICLVPFGGIGKALRIEPSKKNPNFCQSCIEAAPFGVYEMETGVLFADIRGFTAWSEQHEPREVSERLATFHRIATRVFTRDDALVQHVGDQVMVLYLTVFPSLTDRAVQVMVEAGKRFHSALASQFRDEPLPVGIGIHRGIASVGNVGEAYDKDFTAAGDVINTGARLQSCASDGQLVISDAAYQELTEDSYEAESAEFSVKGKAEPLHARVLNAS